MKNTYFKLLLLSALGGSMSILTVGATNKELLQSALSLARPVAGAELGGTVALRGTLTEMDFRDTDRLKTMIAFKSSFNLGDDPRIVFEAKPYLMANKDTGAYYSRDIEIYNDGIDWYVMVDSATHLDSVASQPSSTSKLEQVTIQDELPSFLGPDEEGYVSGRSFIATQFELYEGHTLMELLNNPDYFFGDINVEPIDEGFVVTMSNACEEVKCTFITEGNLMIKSYVYNLGLCKSGQKTTIQYEFDYDKGFEIPGVNVPNKLTRRYKDEKGIDFITEVVLESIDILPLGSVSFRPEIPLNWRVFDRRNNIFFRNVEDPKELLESIIETN